MLSITTKEVGNKIRHGVTFGRPHVPPQLPMKLKKKKWIATDRAVKSRKAHPAAEQYLNILRELPDIVYMIDPDGYFTFLNDSVRMIGYEPEELIGQHFSKILHPDDVTDFSRKYVLPKYEGKQTGDGNAPKLFDERRTGKRKTQELLIRLIPKKGGEEVIVQVIAFGDVSAAGHYNQGSKKTFLGTLGIIRNVTEKVIADNRIRASENKYRILAEQSLQGMAIGVGPELRLVFVNSALAAMLGYTAEELLSFSAHQLQSLIYADDRAMFFQRFRDRLQGKDVPEQYEFRAVKKNGTEIWVMISANRIEYEGRPAVQAAFVEITERKQAEEQTKRSLAEKEVLLRELHHRVKNNMQIISSLLSLQARYIGDEQVKKLCQDSLGRIRSMMFIHERLYKSGNFAQIDFSEYVKAIAQELFRSYGIEHRDVNLEVDIHQVVIDINAAVPCGLIINELVSNSLKHAFPARRRGKIAIRMQATSPGHYSLIVSDDGVGLPADLDHRKTQTLGLQLVNTLVEQLEGRLDLHKERGTEWRIEFKAPA